MCRATLAMRSISATEVPPNFITRRAIGNPGAAGRPTRGRRRASRKQSIPGKRRVYILAGLKRRNCASAARGGKAKREAMERDTQQSHGSTVDADEIAHFEAMAATWWNPRGEMRALHMINPVRLAYIREAACRHFQRDARRLDCLAGLRILDIGCGAGLLSEPLARIGAAMVGADASATNIKTAEAHARQSGLAVDYRPVTAEALADAGE